MWAVIGQQINFTFAWLRPDGLLVATMGATDSPGTLRQQVTSKGGTTEAALKHLEANNVRAIFSQAVAAAAQRSAQLAKELGS